MLSPSPSPSPPPKTTPPSPLPQFPSPRPPAATRSVRFRNKGLLSKGSDYGFRSSPPRSLALSNDEPAAVEEAAAVTVSEEKEEEEEAEATKLFEEETPDKKASVGPDKHFPMDAAMERSMLIIFDALKEKMVVVYKESIYISKKRKKESM